MTPSEIRSLPARQRADHYRKLASEALIEAEEAMDSMSRAALLRVAESWEHLAEYAERSGDPSRFLGLLINAGRTTEVENGAADSRWTVR